MMSWWAVAGLFALGVGCGIIITVLGGVEFLTTMARGRHDKDD